MKDGCPAAGAGAVGRNPCILKRFRPGRQRERPVPERPRAARAGEPLLENTSAADDGWTPIPAGRPETKFERRARMEGRAVRDLVFRRISAPQSFTH